MLLMKILILC